MKTVLPCAAMLVVVLSGVPGSALEPLVLYDDFNAAPLDPDKWVGGEFAPEPRGAGAEAVRQIQDGRLRLAYRAYGRTDSNTGRSRHEFALLFQNAAAVTAMQAAVQVTDAAATGCPGNPEPAMAWATLGGRFFGSAPATPGGAVTDVVANIRVFRRSDATDPPDILRVGSSVFHCANRPCTAGSALHFQDLGAVKRGETARLRIQWDRDNHRFIFQRDDAPEVVAPYAVPDTEPPGIPVKLLDALHFVPNCTAAPRPVAFIEAWFDEVRVNEAAAPRAER
jgi:hypothetical protein